MNRFQLIFVPLLLLGAGGCFWLWIVHRRRRLALATLVCAAAALFVAIPSLTQRAADALGITRGADLVLYLTAFAVLFGWLLTLNAYRKLRGEMTELTRQLALRDLPRRGE